MKQLKFPRRIVSSVQMWGSLFLIFLALIFSFTPIITLNTEDNAPKINELIEKFSSSNVEIPESVEVSAPGIVGSISLITKLMDVSNDSNKAMNGTLSREDAEKLEQKKKELDTYLSGEKGEQEVVTAAVLATSITSLLNFEEQDDILSIILSTVISIAGFLISLGIVVVIPITLIVNFIVALILCIRHIKDPEKVSAEVGNKLMPMLSMPIILLLCQCVVSGVSHASGIIAVTVIAAVSVVLNLVVSRAREYKPDQFVYLNVVQIPAFISIIGFLVFFFNLIKTGVFKTFISGSFFEYAKKALHAVTSGEKVDNGYLIDVVLLFAYIGMAFCCVKYLENAAMRLSCTVKVEKSKFAKRMPKDNAIVYSVLAVLVFVIPAFLASRSHGAGRVSFLLLGKDQTSALTAVLIGALIMLIADVAVIVLRSTFAKIDVERRSEVLTGRAKACEDTEGADSDQEPAEATEGEAAASSEEAEAESEIEAEEEAEIEAKVEAEAEAEAEAEVEAEVEAEAEVETEEAKK